MLADYHIHSLFSDDGRCTMEEIIEKAIELGLSEICFADHVDYGIKIDHQDYLKLSEGEQQKVGKLINVDYPTYFAKIEDLSRQYQDKIIIKQGLEFGMQMHTMARFQKLFDSHELDFVILSCHQVEDKEFWTNDFQKGKTADEYNARYYEEIYNCVCNYKDYSVLGHLDMIQRYNEEYYPFEKSEEMITKILKQVIIDGKGIEINTSSFYYNLKDLMPERAILQLYYELGGKVITIGSDTHVIEQLGSKIEFMQNELKAMGFKQFCTFDKMKPIFHDL